MTMETEIKRKVVHSLGVFSVLLILIFGSFYGALSMLLICISLVLLGEYRKERKLSKILKIKPLDEFEDFLYKEIGTYERMNELSFNGAILFYFSCFLVTLLFNPHVAIASIAVLALADSLATLVGYYFGRHKIFINKKKSWEGSLGFFVMSLFILILFFQPLKALIVSIIVTFVEMLPRIDDNLSVPITTAILLTLLS